MNEYDELWAGGPRFAVSDAGFKLSTDSVLLAYFCEKLRAKSIIDLGCGAGVLTVLLHGTHPSAAICGVEIQPEAAELSRANLTANGFDAGSILTADLRQHRVYLTAGAYDLVVSNPPYFAAGSGLTAPNPSRATARDERCCTLDDLCSAASWLCRWGGAFALVHRPERLSEIFCTMSALGLEPKRLRPVQHRPETVPSLVLIEARRGGKPGLDMEKPLLLCNPDGSDSDEIKTIYHRS